MSFLRGLLLHFGPLQCDALLQVVQLERVRGEAFFDVQFGAARLKPSSRSASNKFTLANTASTRLLIVFVQPCIVRAVSLVFVVRGLKIVVVGVVRLLAPVAPAQNKLGVVG